MSGTACNGSWQTWLEWCPPILLVRSHLTAKAWSSPSPKLARSRSSRTTSWLCRTQTLLLTILGFLIGTWRCTTASYPVCTYRRFSLDSDIKLIRCLIVLLAIVLKLHDCLTPCFLIGINYAPYATKVFCSQTVSKRSIYTQLPYVQTTIETVYAYAKALRTAQRNRCGDSFNGVCDNLRSMPTSEFHNILKNTDFTVSACKRSSKNILKGPFCVSNSIYTKRPCLFNNIMFSFLLQFSASDGIQSLEGQRVRFDANGDIINQDFTVYNYNNRLSNTNFVFEEVR